MSAKLFSRTALGSVVLIMLAGFAARADRADIYDETLDARAAIADAVLKAKADNKHVLLQWGGNWCGWCHLLHELFNSDQAIRSALSEHYEIVMIDSRSNKSLAEELGTQIAGVPYLTVLDASGNKLVDQRTAPLEIGGRHDPAKVPAFLEAWAPTGNDAYKTLDAAKAKARLYGKLLFVQFSTPSCGWCKRLDAFITSEGFAELFNTHYTAVKIDQANMSRAGELRAELSKGPASGGVPWFAIVNAEGNVLSTSTGPRGNIGYPVKSHEIEHFLTMLEETSGDVSGSELAAVKSYLESTAR